MRVRDLTDGCRVAAPYAVRDVALRADGTAGPHLELRIGDRTGAVDAVLEAPAALRAAAHCSPGAIVHVTGRFEVAPSGRARLVLSAVRPARDGETDPGQLLGGPARPVALMEADLRELLGTIRNEHLRRLLVLVLGEESGVWRSYRDAPAAKHYHQAYRHGLLEHSLSVAQAVSASSAVFPGIDRDLAVAGALLHDLGKLEAYESCGEAIAMSDDGRLAGEIALGYYRVRRAIEELAGFPDDLARALGHIILSHHGSLAHGSPVVPCTREATLVHMMDNLGSRLGSFDRVERELPAGERFAAFDKAIGGGAYFPAETGAEHAVAARRAA